MNPFYIFLQLDGRLVAYRHKDVGIVDIGDEAFLAEVEAYTAGDAVSAYIADQRKLLAKKKDIYSNLAILVSVILIITGLWAMNCEDNYHVNPCSNAPHNRVEVIDAVFE